MKIQTTFYLITILICAFFVSSVKINKKSKINTASLTSITVSVTALEIPSSTNSTQNNENKTENWNGTMDYLSQHLNSSFYDQKQKFKETMAALSDKLNGTMAALAYVFNGTSLHHYFNETKSEERDDFNGTYLDQDSDENKSEEKDDFDRASLDHDFIETISEEKQDLNGTYLNHDFNETLNSSLAENLNKQFSKMKNFTQADLEEIKNTLPTSEQVSNWINHQAGQNVTTASDVSFIKNYVSDGKFLTLIAVKEHYEDEGFSKEQMKEIQNRLPSAEQLSSWVNSQVGRNVTAAEAIDFVKENLPNTHNQTAQVIMNLKAFLL